MNAVLAVVAVALIAAFAAIGIVAGEEEEAEPAGQAPLERATERLEEVSRGVERVRELEYDGLPRVRLISAAEAGRESIRELDRDVPLRRQRTEERLLVMLGLLPPNVRLRDVLGDVLTEEVAGYYVPRTSTLALVRGAGLGGFLAEVTLAHELAHALEDQHFRLEPEGQGFLHDGAPPRG